MDHALRAFKRFTKEFEYFNDYRMLATDVAAMISYDRNLNELLKVNRILSAQWEYIKHDIDDDIVEELIMMAYTNRGYYRDPIQLHVAIINEVQDIVRTKLFKPVLDDKIHFTGLQDYFIEAFNLHQEVNLTLEELEQEEIDEQTLEELKRLNTLYKNFSLDYDTLRQLLSSWIPPKWGLPVILMQPIPHYNQASRLS